MADDDAVASHQHAQSFSSAYADIIGNDDDLINMIADCIYKKQKRQFVQKYGLIFNDDRVRNYHHDLNDEPIE